MKNVFGKPWPDGHRELTMLALPDLGRASGGSPLAGLVDDVRRLARKHGLTPVPDAALHLTIQPVNHLRLDTPPVDDATVKWLVDELKDQLRAWSAFSLMMGSPVVGRSGVTLDTHPAHPFDHLVDDVRHVIGCLCGPDAIDYDTRPGHMTIAVAGRDLDTDDFASALRRVRPGHANMMVRDLVLAWVSQDVPARCYTFDVVERFELTGPAERMAAQG